MSHEKHAISTVFGSVRCSPTRLVGGSIVPSWSAYPEGAAPGGLGIPAQGPGVPPVGGWVLRPAEVPAPHRLGPTLSLTNMIHAHCHLGTDLFDSARRQGTVRFSSTGWEMLPETVVIVVQPAQKNFTHKEAEHVVREDTRRSSDGYWFFFSNLSVHKKQNTACGLKFSV